MLPEKVNFVSPRFPSSSYISQSHPTSFWGKKIFWIQSSILLPAALVHSPVKALAGWLTYIFHT